MKTSSATDCSSRMTSAAVCSPSDGTKTTHVNVHSEKRQILRLDAKNDKKQKKNE